MIIQTHISTSLGPAHSEIHIPETPAHVFNYALNLVANGQAKIVYEVTPASEVPAPAPTPKPAPVAVVSDLDLDPPPKEDTSSSSTPKKKRG